MTHKPTSAQATKFDLDFQEADLDRLERYRCHHEAARSVAEAAESKTAGLPTDDASRKELPIFTGVVLYFPDALAAVAHCSKVGNDQHNPGQPLHWAKEKSTDQRNTCLRHMIDAARGMVFDVDGVRHSAKAAWRALAALQTELEQDGLGLFQAPVPPAPEACVCGYQGCVLAHGHLGMHKPFTVTSREGTK